MDSKNKISLNKLEKRLPFSTPDSYFENFLGEMSTRIKHTKQSKHQMLKRWVYVAAACVAGIVTLSQIYFTQNQQSEALDYYDSYVLSQVDESTIYDYYLENY